MGKVMTKINKGLKNNSGFTLIELLTSLSIFAFFSIALLQYMKTASSIQSQVGTNVKLETDVQTAMGVVEEFLIDASASVYFDDPEKTLYIFNNKGYDEVTASGGPIVHAFKWYESDETDSSGKTFNEGDIYYFTAPTGVSKTTTTWTTTVITRTTVEDPFKPGVLEREIFTKVDTTIVKDGDKISETYTISKVEQTCDNGNDVWVTDKTVSGLTDIPLLSPAWTEERDISTKDESAFSGLWRADGTSVLTNPEKLCENISAFNVDLYIPPEDINPAGRIEGCTLSFTMGSYRDTNSGKITLAEYKKDLYIVMRNNPPEAILIA